MTVGGLGGLGGGKGINVCIVHVHTSTHED